MKLFDFHRPRAYRSEDWRRIERIMRGAKKVARVAFISSERWRFALVLIRVEDDPKPVVAREPVLGPEW